MTPERIAIEQDFMLIIRGFIQDQQQITQKLRQTKDQEKIDELLEELDINQ